MPSHAHGTFDVTLTPAPQDANQDTTLGRMLLVKQFHGDLDATSSGQMLTAGTSTQGSAAYVAIEKISGSLQGHKGTFVAMHSATMTRGTPHLSITIVPDSGTEDLVGLSGTMTITITDDQHDYDMMFTLVETP